MIGTIATGAGKTVVKNCKAVPDAFDIGIVAVAAVVLRSVSTVHYSNYYD